MSLHLDPIGEIPTETARVARAAFPKGNVVMRLRDEFNALYQDAMLCGGFTEADLRRGSCVAVYPGPGALLACFDASPLGE